MVILGFIFLDKKELEAQNNKNAERDNSARRKTTNLILLARTLNMDSP